MRSCAELHPHRGGGGGGGRNNLKRASKVEIESPGSAQKRRSQPSAAVSVTTNFSYLSPPPPLHFHTFLLEGRSKRADQTGGLGLSRSRKQGLKPPLKVRGRGGKSHQPSKVSETRKVFFRRSRPSSPPDGPGLSTESDAAPTFASNPSCPEMVRTHRACERARARVWNPN